MKSLILLSFFLISTSFINISSQTIELEFLRQKEAKINTYYYKTMTTKDRIEKLRIVEDILKDFDVQNFSVNDKKLITIAETLAMEGVFDKQYENNMLMNNYPEVRVQAIRLLAKLGGDSQRDLVMNIFINDDDLEVKAEACEAFIKFGENENGDVVRTVIHVYRKYLPRYPKLIFAMINAMREFVTTSSPSYDAAVYLLTEIKTGSFNNTIKEKANEAINHILTKS